MSSSSSWQSPLLPVLVKAREALDEDPALLLDRLLEAWRIVRAPAIADAIDLVSKLCREGQPSLTGALAAHTAEWSRVAREQKPVDLDRLVESLLLREADPSTERVELLRLWPPNPRFTTAFTEHLVPNAFTGTKRGRTFWRTVERLLLDLRDTRMPDRYNPPGIRSRTGHETARAWARPRLLDESELAVFGEIVARLENRAAQAVGTHRSGDELLAAVYASPQDDGPRQVYGDWLLEQKDVRGEFIALQFVRHANGKLSRADGARERALLDQHWKTWLGGVASVVRKGSFTFERGFLASAKLLVAPSRLNEIEWSTCREIDLSRVIWSPDGTLYALTGSPHLRSLETIYGTTGHVLNRIATGKNSAGKPSNAKHLDPLRARLRKIAFADAHRVTVETMNELRLPELRELVAVGEGLPHVLFGGAASNPHLARLERIKYTDRTTDTTMILERNDESRLARVRVAGDVGAAIAGIETMCTSLGLTLARE